MQEIVTVASDFINQTGFPIFIAIYVLVRMENTIKENTKVTNDLINVLKITFDNKGE